MVHINLKGSRVSCSLFSRPGPGPAPGYWLLSSCGKETQLNLAPPFSSRPRIRFAPPFLLLRRRADGAREGAERDLRHEATSRFFEKGLNPMQVAAITGHKTLQMLKRYTHLKAEDLAEMLK